MLRRPITVALLLILAALGGCGELQDWRSTQRTDTLEAYESFVARYPQSQYVPVAQRRLTDLVEQRDWLIATESDTAEGYRAFINAHPKGRWTREASAPAEFFDDPGSTGPRRTRARRASARDVAGGACSDDVGCRARRPAARRGHEFR